MCQVNHKIARTQSYLLGKLDPVSLADAPPAAGQWSLQLHGSPTSMMLSRMTMMSCT